MLGAYAVVFLADLRRECRLLLFAAQTADDRHGARGVQDVDHRLAVTRRNLHRRVRLARGGTADEQRQFQALAFHLARHVCHFVERRRDESAQADDVHVLLASGLQNFLARHHHAEVNHLVVVAAEHDADNILADVMHVALDGGHQNFSGVFVHTAGGFLFRFHERLQICHGLFHHAGGLHHLRQEHFPGTKQIADHVHPGHERAFDDEQRLAIFLPGFLDVGVNEIHDALDQRMAEAFFDRALAPFILDDLRLALLFHRLGKLDQPLGRVGPAVEQHVLDQREQILRHLLVNRQHAGVDDAHVEPGLDGVIQKRAVHRLAHGVVAAKAEADVADAAADLRVRQVFLDPLRRADEVHGVVRVFLHAGADGEDVRVKNNVLRRNTDFLDQQIVGAAADFGAPLKRIRLAAFIKGHHHHGRAVAADQLRLVQKLFLAFLERNGIYDALALQAFQAGLDDLPFRGVHHHRHFADVRLGRDEVEKPRHRGDAINHSFVHADVNDLRAVLDLLARDGERGLVIAGLDELGELRRPGHVGALADVDEIDGRVL